MVTYVLDSSAILRYLANEAGAARVADIIRSHVGGTCEAIVSAPHWGEVAGVIGKTRGREAMNLALSRLREFGFQVVPADGDRAVGAAMIRLKRKIPYVDAFGVELAANSPERVLVTADFDFKPASRDVTIEFLPAK